MTHLDRAPRPPEKREPVRAERGSTLVELMITVVIFSILMAIALPNFLSTRSRSAEAVMRADLHNIMTMLEDYKLQTGEFPPDAGSFQGVTGLDLSDNVSYTTFSREVASGVMSVHIDLNHTKAVKTMHIHYPAESNRITFH